MEKKPRALTMKREMFVQAYCETLNGTESYKKAYKCDNDNVAAVEASKILRKPNIQERIEEIRKYTTGKFNITRERIAKEYARIAFADRTKIFDAEGNVMPLNELDEEIKAIISGLDIEELYAGDTNIGKTKKVKTYDKKGALDSLAKMFGFNEPEKIKSEIQNSFPGGVLQIVVVPAPEGSKGKEL